MGKKRCSRTIDIVSYTLEVSVNGVTCVFVVISGHQTHFKVCKPAYQLTSMCPPTHVWLATTLSCIKALQTIPMFTCKISAQNMHNWWRCELKNKRTKEPTNQPTHQPTNRRNTYACITTTHLVSDSFLPASIRTLNKHFWAVLLKVVLSNITIVST